MCTTMRRLRRGTPRGVMCKMFKRKVTRMIMELKRGIDLSADAGLLMQRISALKDLRRMVKI